MVDMTSSHSEREIFDGCVALMQELTGHFERYLEYIGVDVKAEDNEERFVMNGNGDDFQSWLEWLKQEATQ